MTASSPGRGSWRARPCAREGAQRAGAGSGEDGAPNPPAPRPLPHAARPVRGNRTRVPAAAAPTATPMSLFGGSGDRGKDHDLFMQNPGCLQSRLGLASDNLPLFPLIFNLLRIVIPGSTAQGSPLHPLFLTAITNDFHISKAFPQLAPTSVQPTFLCRPFPRGERVDDCMVRAIHTIG